MNDNFSSSGSLTVSASSLGGELLNLLMADDITPGSDPSYQLCKTIYLYHPLGLKMAETPITVAQSQQRKRVVQGAPEEVLEEFTATWDRLHGNEVCKDTMRLARIYGISALVLVEEDADQSLPLDMLTLWKRRISFNTLDPLNTAGSLVLSQVPTNRDFNKPATVRTNGKTFHPTRFEVTMNEQPVYLAYTSSAFGFVGRSVYQRALFPLKSYVRMMIADDMIATKLGLLVAKQKRPGSIIDTVMQKVAGLKRGLLKEAQTGQVLSIDTEESVETLNMMNVDGAGGYSRTNIIKNVATAADMPAKILDNETLVSGFGEGTEDAKNIARYIDSVRAQMETMYRFVERMTMYCAWTPPFFERMVELYPSLYKDMGYTEAFAQWRDTYHADWPSLLIEPESEQIKVEDVKVQSVIAMVQTLLPELDPDNRQRLIAWAADNLSENRRLFPYELELDYDELRAYAAKQDSQQQDQAQQVYDKSLGGEAKRMGRFE